MLNLVLLFCAFITTFLPPTAKQSHHTIGRVTTVLFFASFLPRIPNVLSAQCQQGKGANE